jgi:5-carboxymethyl-2-hydroxymuconate isomerase
MPHLTIDYSARLDGVLDREALLRALHPLVLKVSGSRGVCKTLMRPVETYVGDGAGGRTAFVHVEVGLMPGRSEARKGCLSESIVALLAERLPADGAEGVVISAEVRDLAGSYRLSPRARRAPDPAAGPLPAVRPAPGRSAADRPVATPAGRRGPRRAPVNDIATTGPKPLR